MFGGVGSGGESGSPPALPSWFVSPRPFWCGVMVRGLPFQLSRCAVAVGALIPRASPSGFRVGSCTDSQAETESDSFGLAVSLSSSAASG
eukprot:3409871-Rhodomonas_salina.3